MKQSVKETIENFVKKSRKTYFLRSDFDQFGSYRQIGRALTTLESEGLLSRPGHGIYSKPSGRAVDPQRAIRLLNRRLGKRVSRTIRIGDRLVQIGTSRSLGRYLNQQPDISATGQYIVNLAKSNNVAYNETPTDRLADTVTRLADDEVKMDHVEKLLIALERAGVIPRENIVPLHINYLREKLNVRPIQ